MRSLCVALIERSVAVSELPVKFPADHVPLTVTFWNVDVPDPALTLPASVGEVIVPEN